ncbi:TPM domain-containing protein [Lacticaseibacillus sp. GG6-2]
MRIMRKYWWLIALMIGLIGGTQQVQASENRYVYDHADVLSPATEKKIETINTRDFAKLPGHPVLAVEIYKRIPGNEDTADYKVKRFEQLGIGRQDWDNGLYFVMATQTHKYGFATGYGLESALPDAEADNIVTPHVKTQLRAGNYDTAVSAIVGNIRHRLIANKSNIMTPADIKAKQAAHRRNVMLMWLIAVVIVLIPIFLVWRHKRRRKRLLQAFTGGIGANLPLYLAMTPGRRKQYRRNLAAPWFAAMPKDLEAWVRRDFMAYVRANLADLVAGAKPTAPEPLFVYGMVAEEDLRDYDEAGLQAPTLAAYLTVIESTVALAVDPLRQYLKAFGEWAKHVSLTNQQAVWAEFAANVSPADATKLAKPEAQQLVFATILAYLNGQDVSDTDWALMPMWVQSGYDTPISTDDHDDFGSGDGFGGGDTGGGGFDGGW